MAKTDPQKSEVHDTTADAGGSPTAPGDAATTRAAGEEARPGHVPQQHPEPIAPGTVIKDDESDIGGPIVIESSDPDLSPPQPPQDPFPTNATPEFDPPVKKRE